MMFILAIGLGLLIGIVVGALGAGGGILSVPVLVYLLGQSPHEATASSLLIVGLTALVSLFSPGRRQYVHYRKGAIFGTLAIAGSLVGSYANAIVAGAALMYMFAVLLVAVGIVMLRKGIKNWRESEAVAESDSPATKSRRDSANAAKILNKEAGKAAAAGKNPLWPITAVALGTGFLTGFFGVGGGFIVVPMLILVLGMPIKAASSTSLVVMVITAISGILARIGAPLAIDWAMVMAFALASMAGGFIGGPITAKVRPAALTIAFGVLLVGVAIVSTVANSGIIA